MKKILVSLILMMSLVPTVNAHTIDSVEFSDTPGKLVVKGHADNEMIAVELLARTGAGGEEERLEYVNVEKCTDGEFSHNVLVNNPQGLYSLKINDGADNAPSGRYLYLSDKLTADGINTDMGNTVEVGEKLSFYTNVKNYTSSEIALYYVVGYYDDLGVLLGTDMEEISVQEGAKKLEYNVSVKPVSNASELKVFILDTDMHPLSRAVSADIAPHTDIFVSEGAKNGDGSFEKPYATIVQATRKAKELSGNKMIFVREGVYKDFVMLDKMNDVTICPYNDEKVVFTNSEVLDSASFTSIKTNDKIYNRLPSASRDKVKVFNLGNTGISTAGAIPQVVYGEPESSYDILSVDNERCTLSRFPNEGYTQIFNGTSDANSLNINYIYSDGARWTSADELWVNGFWSSGWAMYSFPASCKIPEAQIDPSSRYSFKITTEGSLGAGAKISGGMPSGRFYVFNIPEEMDAENEYYIDTETNKMYLYTTKELDGATIRLASKNTPVISANGCKSFKIRGINFENIKGNAIDEKDADGSAVTECTFKNIGLNSIAMTGDNITVKNNIIESIGAGGIRVTGEYNDRMTLTSSNNVITDNIISDYAQDYRVYNPAIGVSGVGNYVAHNTIYDAPHVGIQFEGNENVIEYNRIYNILKETGDAGAIYGGQNLLGSGNLIQNNYFENFRRVSFVDENGKTIKTTGVASIACVYLDDMFSGATVRNNVMNNVDIGVHMGGGCNNTIINNIIMNKTSDGAPIDADNRGSDGKHNVSGVVAKMAKIPYTTGIWASKYPENLLINIIETGNSSIPYTIYPQNDIITNNIYYNHNDEYIRNDVKTYGNVSNNVVTTQPDYSEVYQNSGARQ